MINNRANAPNTAALCGSQRDGNANKLSVHLPPFLSSFPQRPNYRNGNVSWPRQRPSGCALLLQYYPLFPVRVRPPDRPTERVLYLAEMRPRKLGSLQRHRRARSRPFLPPSSATGLHSSGPALPLSFSGRGHGLGNRLSFSSLFSRGHFERNRLDGHGRSREGHREVNRRLGEREWGYIRRLRVSKSGRNSGSTIEAAANVIPETGIIKDAWDVLIKGPVYMAFKNVYKVLSFNLLNL